MTTNTNEIWRFIREFFERLYSNKLENLEEMDKFLHAFKQPKLNQEDISHLNRSVTSNENEAVIESPNKDSQSNSTRPLKN
jgi:hypothetical protein